MGLDAVDSCKKRRMLNKDYGKTPLLFPGAEGRSGISPGSLPSFVKARGFGGDLNHAG
jgi:hypothetical protein